MKKTAYTDLAEKIGQKEAEKKATPQTKVIPGREKDMTRNSAGGVSFKVDEFTRLDRFLILGSEGGSYYASERKLTADNAKNVLAAIKKDGLRVVNRVVEISDAGRAPKNDPALLVLALAMTQGDTLTKEAAIEALPKVARIGTHLFTFAELIKGMTKFSGKSDRKPELIAIRNWYVNRSAMALAGQITKYASRKIGDNTWAHRDLIRLSHPKAPSPEHDALFAYAVDKQKSFGEGNVAEYMDAIAQIKAAKTAKDAAKLITAHKLPREVVPTELLTDVAVWEALMPHMGITALVRNLATLTRIGYITPMGAGTKAVLAKLTDVEAIRAGRFHPIAALAALLTYKAGRSARGSNTWTPVAKIVDALDELFYTSFGLVVPTGKRTGLFLDVSGSMTGGEIAGVPGLTPRVASAAMAMLALRTEKDTVIAGFTSGSRYNWGGMGGRSGYAKIAGLGRSLDGITELPLTAKQRLDDACATVDNLDFGGTDCSLPMLWADKLKIDLDAFVVYTDSETYAGRMAPSQALQQYRGNRGIPAKLVVVGMVANNFTIADPQDAGMLDVVGFDTAAPELMNGFIRGEF